MSFLIKAIRYDLQVNWSRRLGREFPFYHRLFQEHQARRIVDWACGTGRHAVYLSQQGYEVTGVDVSLEMLELARENAAREGAIVTWVESDLCEVGEELDDLSPFDGALCVGNSLSVLDTQEKLERAFVNIHRELRSGGVFIAQILNYELFPGEGIKFDTPRRAVHQDKEMLFLKFFDMRQGRLTANFLNFQREEEGWALEVETSPLYPWKKPAVEAALTKAGFAPLTFFGDHQFTPFDPQKSHDLIWAAEKKPSK
jgi:SAM-dependent methyltransferase